MNELPSVSIVIVNYNGLQHLKDCIASIRRLNYPKELIELIFVDNNSTDGSVELLQKNYPWVRLLRNERNEGFARPCNTGAKAATGEYVAFLNNDMRVQRDWLIELINTMRRSKAECAGSVMLNWNGKLLDFAGGSVNFFGMGYQFNFHAPLEQVADQLSKDREILFACGGAMIARRDVFLSAGGFDEDYFAYFEDVDLGWRLRVLGYKIVLSVKSRTYHKHHGTSRNFQAERMQLLFDRNKLYTIYKNYGEELLQKAFWPTVLLDVAILADTSGLDRDLFDLNLSRGQINDTQRIDSMSSAQLLGLRAFIENLPKMTEKRRAIQQARRTSDDDIIRFIPDPFMCLGKDQLSYARHKFDFVKAFGIDTAFHMKLKPKVLLACADKVGTRMAGPAIRYFEMAKALAPTCDVTLACSGETDLTPSDFRIQGFTYDDPSQLVQAAVGADVVLYQGFISKQCPAFRKALKDKYLIVDLYDPYVIENVEIFRERGMKDRRESYEFSFDTLREQLASGDFFLCANETQKDYWLGMLSALNRLTPESYDYSRDGSKIVSIVPFGLSDEPPVHTRNVLKGVWPGIAPDDKVLIWGGGVWNWFDPLTLIRAVKRISEQRSDVKLFFMGVKSPNPGVPEMKILNEAVSLAKELGIYDTYVMFNFGWVDYADRQNYLLEADLGVSCHFNTLETRFSFRTRILDYLWANLPIVCTKGDYFGKLAEEEGLGLAVDYEDDEKLAAAILRLLDDRELYERCRTNAARVAEGYRWSKVVQPVVDFCKKPVHIRKGIGAGEKTEAEDLEETAVHRKGSVPGRLSNIEQTQASLEKMIRSNRQMVAQNSARLREIQTWTYMMNNRFNRVKHIFSPLKVFRRLFRRK